MLFLSPLVQAAETMQRPSPLQPQPIDMEQQRVTDSLAPQPWSIPLHDGEESNEFQLSVRDSVELNVSLTDDQESRFSGSGEYAGTTGVWRPVDSVSLKAGFGVGQQSYGGPSAGGQFGCLAGSSDYLDCIALQASQSGAETSVQTYTVGASWQPSERFEVSVDYYNQSQEASLSNAVSAARLGAASTLVSNGLLSTSRTQGLDVSLSCDIDAGNLGDLELGLQFSRIVQEGEFLSSSASLDPVNQAVLGVGWQRGDFRGDLTSRYLDMIGTEGASPESWTTFDINFAWRTPWNASLSVGARNVLDSPAPNSSGLTDMQFEDLLGRVPYVRYKQDL